jgi:hypothetical protein
MKAENNQKLYFDTTYPKMHEQAAVLQITAP